MARALPHACAHEHGHAQDQLTTSDQSRTDVAQYLSRTREVEANGSQFLGRGSFFVLKSSSLCKAFRSCPIWPLHSTIRLFRFGNRADKSLSVFRGFHLQTLQHGENRNQWVGSGACFVCFCIVFAFHLMPELCDACKTLTELSGVLSSQIWPNWPLGHASFYGTSRRAGRCCQRSFPRRELHGKEYCYLLTMASFSQSVPFVLDDYVLVVESPPNMCATVPFHFAADQCYHQIKGSCTLRTALSYLFLFCQGHLNCDFSLSIILAWTGIPSPCTLL